jgi:hypothetical protein
MKTLVISFCVIVLAFYVKAQSQEQYMPLDPENPISFLGDRIVYNQKTIELGSRAFFIDGQLSEDEASKYPFVFNSVNDAAKHLTDGTESKPMVLYIAPYVYWIDDPDDDEIRVPEPQGRVPFGLEIDCEWLRFSGLTDNPQKVILASNRGQTMGAKGNFTMFNIIGNGTSAENITFGNYCNIDLEYPLKPELNQKKRGAAIVQAQLVFCRGDKIVARNTHFVSRLNLCPFTGGERTLFDQCYFELTDDALAPKGVYLNSQFEFYSSKPFYNTSGTGAVFLNCDIKSFTRGEQYFAKSNGPIAVIDTRLISNTVDYWGWRDKPGLEDRYYQYNNYSNNGKVLIGDKHLYATVNMEGYSVLNAYRFEHAEGVVYNTYNLLKGDDEWDPMNIKELVLEAEKESGDKYTDIATLLVIPDSRAAIETGKDTINLKAQAFLFGGYETDVEGIKWSVTAEHSSLVALEPGNNGSCRVIPTNQNDQTSQVVITASTTSGLEAASVISVKPSILEAPEFKEKPTLVLNDNGTLTVKYDLDMRFDDQSLISWYRCSDMNGSKAVEIAVSRFNDPMYDYSLSKGDKGYYIMAVVSPKHLRCEAGVPVKTIFERPILSEDIKDDGKIMFVNLKNISTKYQPEIKPGFWSFDSHAPKDTREYNWEADNSGAAWYYGTGVNGASQDTGLVQCIKGARMRYTPVKGQYGDMSLSFTACPAKTAGQGFSSARAQYLDVGIKFDTENMSGYALRLIRTIKYGDAIDCYFVKYTDGNVERISNPVTTSCYRTPCYINVQIKGNKLSAQLETTADYYIKPGRPEVLQNVDIETKTESSSFGGVSIQHTSSVGSGATLIKDLVIKWQ